MLLKCLCLLFSLTTKSDLMQILEGKSSKSLSLSLVQMSTNVVCFCHRCVKYYLLLLMLLQASTSLFRLIGAIGRDMIVAFLYAYFILLLVMSLCGFVLPRGIECVPSRGAARFIFEAFMNYVLDRGHQELVDLGLLYFTNDVCRKCTDG